MKPETLAVLRVVAQRETASGLVGMGELIDAVGLEPNVAVNEVERLLREGYITCDLQKLMSGSDPRPWFLVNPLVSEKGGSTLEAMPLGSGDTKSSGALSADRWDAFISHASEDKAGFVASLARELTSREVKIWYDDDLLEVGDSVRKAIDAGLLGSDFGIVVISRDFMRKDWTNRELEGILALEQGEKRLLPVWHGVGFEEVKKYSPTVAGRFAARSAIGVVPVADALCRAMKRGKVSNTHSEPVEPEPGPIFMSQLGQLANARVYAWVVIGTVQETDTKFSDDEIESITSWVGAMEPSAVASIANSGFIRMAVDAPDGGGTLWSAEVQHGPVVTLLTALEFEEVPDANHEAVVSFEHLAGWWATVLGGVAALAGNLQLDRVRLGFGLYPYGPNSIRVIGLNFGEAPSPVQRARHQVPPWHSHTALFDPFNPPGGVLDSAVHSLLDTFSYGRVEQTQQWVAEGIQNGTLKGTYRGHATS
jgi:hypothetical protein